MRKKNRILTESEKKQILKNKESLIIDNFRNVFNRIKRIDEQELNDEAPSTPEVLFPDWLIGKLRDVHSKPGQGSIFNGDINKIVELGKSIVNKEKNIDTIANTSGTISTKVPNIGYDLVITSDMAKNLPNAKKGEIQKSEGNKKITVPSVKTSAPIKQFATDKLSIIVRPMKNDSGEVIPNSYIILSMFPGNPDVPRASEWNGKWVVVIPGDKDSMKEDVEYKSESLEGGIKQIVDEIEKMFEDNGYIIDADIIVDNDMSPDYLDSTEEVERALEYGEINPQTVLEMICGFLEIKYDEKIVAEPQNDVIYIYEKGNREDGSVLAIKVKSNL